MATITVPTSPAVRRAADRLLLAGALAGPVFLASAIAQMLAREGFDITRHPISQLSAGSLGWIQVTTFVLAGLGSLALAIAAVVLTVRCVRRRAVLPAVLNGAAAIVLLLPMSPDHMSIQIAVNGLAGFT
jgi:Protein of unknown function (DUF998)